MINYPEWDDFCRGAWKSFEEKVFAKAASLEPVRSDITYAQVAKTVEDYWEQWVNGSAERQNTFGKAKEGLALRIYQELHSPVVTSIPPVPQKSWVTEADKKCRYYWPLTRKVMVDSMGQGVTKKIDDESENVLQHLQDPRKAQQWLVRGLVIGSIQAGKTANYSALISKAADAGYRLIIVLAGVHNDLRRQTQERLDHDFTGFSKSDKLSWSVGVGLCRGYDQSRQPQSATDLEEDFGGTNIKMEERPWLVVMKKEPHRLSNFIAWLKNQSKSKPVLIIDDEADQASMNTVAKMSGEEELDNVALAEERQEASKINSLIRQIIKLFPCCSYVGYTASPFANLFADASADSEKLGEDLFPKDFIVQLSTPDNYFGPKEYFDPDSKEESVLFVPFPLDEANKWIVKNQNEVGNLPPTARKCILQFIVSAAIKFWRAHCRKGILSSDKPEESSMLIHVSHKVDVQAKLAQQISEACCNIRRCIKYEEPDSELGSELEVIFEQQRATTEIVRAARDDVDRKKDWALPESCSDLWTWIQKTVEALAVVVVNGESEPDREGLLRMDADADKCLKPLIWIGGNKLSRGLTIPSLCMSIFLRTTGAADSLLQMGRWFGYRDGYADLCRISTTILLADRFMKVSCTLDDLGEQISTMNNLVRTPKDYRLIVQQHPGFLLTSPNKMRTATDASCCYAGYHTEMRQFLVADQTPHNNFVAAEHLVEDADNFGRRVYDSDCLEKSEEKQPNWTKENTHPSGCLWRSVPADVVMQFFKSYCSPEGIGSSNREIGRILRYIEKENKEGRLLNWNIWLPKGRNSSDWLPLRGEFYPSERNSQSDKLDGAYLRLSILQTSYDQFNGVRKSILDAARQALEALETNEKRGELFRQVRLFAARPEAAGEFANEGYLRLYAVQSRRFNEDKRDSLLSLSGNKYPLISYAVWMPGSLTVQGKINSSVTADNSEEI